MSMEIAVEVTAWLEDGLAVSADKEGVSLVRTLGSRMRFTHKEWREIALAANQVMERLNKE